MSRLLCLLAVIGLATLAGGAPPVLAQTGDVPRELVDYVFSDDAELDAGAVYTVTGTLVVPSGVTLTIPVDVELHFNRGAGLDIDGAVVVDSEDPEDNTRAVLTTRTRIPGWWRGVRVTNPFADIRKLAIEYADVGLDLSATESALVLKCEILEFKRTGILLTPEPPDRPTFHVVQETLIENQRGPRGTGIDARGIDIVDILVPGVRVTGMERGLALAGTASDFGQIIAGSIFENSTVGIEISGSATPEIGGSSFWNNGTAVRFTPDTIVGGSLTASRFDDNGINLDLRAVAPGQPPTLNVDDNYWDTTDEDEIEASILDSAEEPRAPKAVYDRFQKF